MFLKQIELKGFKSFAEKTTIDFPEQHGGHVITGVVGPNGSGKSNIADAIRWVLGEQSVKMLRGKKSQDVIFAGTDKKAKLGSAEVLLHLDNNGGNALIDMSEIIIGRRLYRNGESEYLINGKVSKLQDINLLLAKAHFGHRTYSIIGQGMVDSFVTASPAERQELLEEAAGVKEFQLRKHDSINKLANSLRNLEQVQTVLTEIGPRLRSLTRQVKRLERKETLAKELSELQLTYYGAKWQIWQKQLDEVIAKEKKNTDIVKGKEKEVRLLQKTWHDTTTGKTVSEAFQKMQNEYEKILDKRNKLFEKEFEIKNEIERETVVEKRGNPLASPGILERITGYLKKSKNVLEKIVKINSIEELHRLNEEIEEARSAGIMLEKTFTVEKGKRKVNPELIKKLKDIEVEKGKAEIELKKNQENIQRLKKDEQNKNIAIVKLQEDLQKEQKIMTEMVSIVNDSKIEKARLDTKIEDITAEIKEENISLEKVKNYKEKTINNEDALRTDIGKVKHQLELIGGIDDETVEEYKSTKERFDFLSKEVEDTTEAIKSLEKVIHELEEQIHKQFHSAFININKLFQKYFHILFNGGKATLKKLKVKDSQEISSQEDEAEENQDEDMLIGEAAIKKRLKKFTSKNLSGGVDIEATPPGKKLSSINMLSGGEKALTAIALICSIIANRPSPFVVLDEVDAALDEANSERYANILADLSGKTQFIVITHNRATMHQAIILYGVSMGNDGVSKLLHVDLEKAEQTIQ